VSKYAAERPRDQIRKESYRPFSMLQARWVSGAGESRKGTCRN